MSPVVGSDAPPGRFGTHRYRDQAGAAQALGKPGEILLPAILQPAAEAGDMQRGIEFVQPPHGAPSLRGAPGQGVARGDDRQLGRPWNDFSAHWEAVSRRGPARRAAAWRGEVGPGAASLGGRRKAEHGRGLAWYGQARRSWHAPAWHGAVRSGRAGFGWAGSGQAGRSWHGEARRGWAWCGAVWSGVARPGQAVEARHGRSRLGGAGFGR